MPRIPSARTSALAVMASCLAGPALAHAHLIRELPPANAVVAAAPAEVRLTFSEGLEARFTSVKVTGPGSATVSAGPVALDPKNNALLIVPLRGPLAAGTYKVEWHAVSTDTHKTQGSYSFTIKP